MPESMKKQGNEGRSIPLLFCVKIVRFSFTREQAVFLRLKSSEKENRNRITREGMDKNQYNRIIPQKTPIFPVKPAKTGNFRKVYRSSMDN